MVNYIIHYIHFIFFSLFCLKDQFAVLIYNLVIKISLIQVYKRSSSSYWFAAVVLPSQVFLKLDDTIHDLFQNLLSTISGLHPEHATELNSLTCKQFVLLINQTLDRDRETVLKQITALSRPFTDFRLRLGQCKVGFLLRW